MCPTCHTTLDHVGRAGRAADQGAHHRGRSRQCWTAQQIEAELVANFGPAILAAPPHKGFDLLAWWLPLGGVLAGASLLAVRRLALEPARGPDDDAGPPGSGARRPSGDSTSCSPRRD